MNAAMWWAGLIKFLLGKVQGFLSYTVSYTCAPAKLIPLSWVSNPSMSWARLLLEVCCSYEKWDGNKTFGSHQLWKYFNKSKFTLNILSECDPKKKKSFSVGLHWREICMEVEFTAEPPLPWKLTDVTHRMETFPTGPGFSLEVSYV